MARVTVKQGKTYRHYEKFYFHNCDKRCDCKFCTKRRAQKKEARS